LFSLHVPKTAGTTLITVLPLWFPAGQILYHYGRPFFRGMPARHKFGAGDIIHGHFANDAATGLQAYYPEARQFITFLRDPFDRLVSHYFQLCGEERARGVPVTGFDRFFDWYLSDVAESGRLRATNYLPPHLSNENYEQEIDGLFVHFGLYEAFFESLEVLAAKLSPGTGPRDVVAWFPRLPRLRRSPRDLAIPETARDRFEREFSGSLEYRLYQHARKLHAAESKRQPVRPAAASRTNESRF
jgi:hypothetical protein